MSKKTFNLLLLVILILGGLARLSSLHRYPAGFTPDEADFGYNAYSLLLTGKDEWGTPAWALFYQNLRSFGDYKLPLYAFLAVPTVRIWGLNEMATRLPNAVFGTLAIAGVCLLAQQLFHHRRLSLLAAFMFAVSPWSISLSRGAFESNLVTFFLPLAIYLYMRSRYSLSAVFFALDIYTYHSARLITPFILLALFIFYRPKLTRSLIIGLVVFCLLSLPAVISYTGAGQSRLSDVSLLNPTDNWSGVADRRFQDAQAGLPDVVSRVFSNKLTTLFQQSADNYLSYLSPQFLFIQGAGEATYGMIPGRGVLYLVEGVFLILALFRLIRHPVRPLLFVLTLLLLGPLPATFAKGLGFSANRAATMLPFLILLLAFGWSYLLDLSGRYLTAVTLLIFAVYLVQVSFFAEDYLYHAPRLNAPAMSYGWAEAVRRFKPISGQYSLIKISRSLSEPQIFIAFYWPIPPADYQAASRSWSDFNLKGYRFLDQYDGYHLGDFRFGNLNPADSISVPTLYIGKPDEFPPKFPYYFQIFSPTGLPAIQVSGRQP